jgi:hypothetical protein
MRRRRCERRYVLEKTTEDYAETPVTKIYEQVMGGRNLIARFPRSRTREARMLLRLLEEEE